jgi:hypothetical protein
MCKRSSNRQPACPGDVGMGSNNIVGHVFERDMMLAAPCALLHERPVSIQHFDRSSTHAYRPRMQASSNLVAAGRRGAYGKRMRRSSGFVHTGRAYRIQGVRTACMSKSSRHARVEDVLGRGKGVTRGVLPVVPTQNAVPTSPLS